MSTERLVHRIGRVPDVAINRIATVLRTMLEL